jgi:nucleoporin GLE1
MKLYGALVQTEIPNIQNPHGLQEGWAWLARFLIFCQPMNVQLIRSTRSCKCQFMKMLNVFSENFLVDPKSQNVPQLNQIVLHMQAYIDDKKCLT